MIPSEATELLEFWFGDCLVTGTARSDLWFASNAAFDERCRQRFGSLHASALRGEIDEWGNTPRGTLALVVLLDQLSRNLGRGTAAAFAGDAKALALARKAVALGWDRQLHPFERSFLYLPFEHSEKLADQKESVRLFTQLREETSGAFETEEALRYAREHHDTIRRFGRFPHRNQCLGRTSTPEELRYLESAPRYGQ